MDAQNDKLLWLLFEGHALRVMDLTAMVCAAMGLRGGKALRSARRGALLHDIGKLYVPERILLKPGKLTRNEWEIMRQHPVWGADMIREHGALNGDWQIARFHHEHWDGSGYPDGIGGLQIPLAARAFAPIDVFDALIRERPYRAALSETEAWEIVEEGSGKLFDPEAVLAFRYAWRMMQARAPREEGDDTSDREEDAAMLKDGDEDDDAAS